MVAEVLSTFNHPIRQEEARDAAVSDQKMDNYDHSAESDLAPSKLIFLKLFFACANDRLLVQDASLSGHFYFNTQAIPY